jgi:hypothetical protein
VLGYLLGIDRTINIEGNLELLSKCKWTRAPIKSDTEGSPAAFFDYGEGRNNAAAIAVARKIEPGASGHSLRSKSR